MNEDTINLQNLKNKMSRHVNKNYNKLYEATLTFDNQQLEQFLEKLTKEMTSANLEQLISTVCTELKLNNIDVSDDTLLLLERVLLQIRYFCNDSKITFQFSDIENRIMLIKEIITDLCININNDEVFISALTFVAKHIHVLKHLLKCTYDRLPWEEIEFCVLCFIRKCKAHHELNMFFTMQKRDILKYLRIFFNKLVKLNTEICNIQVVQLSKIPKAKRDEVIEAILEKYPEFQGLYNSYEHIRDIHSLSLISEYVVLVNNVNPKEKNGQNVIIRALQIIGEHIKNTLESPKLSKTTSDLLLLSLHKNTRKIVINLRDSLTHVHSLTERLKLQENEDLDFFTGIKTDIKKIGRVIEHILLKNKIQLIRAFGNQFIDCEDVEKMKKIATNFKNFKILDLLDNFRSRSDISEIGQLKSLVEALNKNVTNPSNFIRGIFQEMQQLLRTEERTKHETEDLIMNIAGDSMAFLRYIIQHFLENSNFIRANTVQHLKDQMKRVLEIITPKIELQNLERIAEMTLVVRMHSLHQKNYDEICRIVNEIIHTVKFGIDRITWTEKFQKLLRHRYTKTYIGIENKNQYKEINNEFYREKLTLKLAELEDIFNLNSDKKPLTYLEFRNNRELQVVVEVLLIDIFSISISLQKFKMENKIFFLDSEIPSIMGKNMRNNLAHNNFLIEVLFHPTLTLFLNAEKVNREGLTCLERNIGKVRKYEYSELRNQYCKIIEIVSRKQKMFSALRDGDFETFSTLITDGADMRAKDFSLATCLHFAAESFSSEIVEHLYNQGLNIRVKNSELQTPLHVAASKGNTKVVQFILNSSADCLDDTDNSKKTALHYAAQSGVELVVRSLMKYKAHLDVKDVMSFTPLHYAVVGANKRIVQILLEYYTGKSLPETCGGVTLLHMASENGVSEIIKILLKRNVNVNAKTDTGATPLISAVCYGQLEAVNVLVQNGAHVNAVCVNGDSPLFYAAEKNFERIVDILLQHGANVNVTDLEGRYTPLHGAMQEGNVTIAKNLLHNGAELNAVTVAGFTALHFAVQARHHEVVKFFLQQKDVDFNAKCHRKQFSPLHYAAENGDVEIAKLLIAKGAKLYDKSDRESTIYLAAKNAHEAILDLLIKNGASVNVKNLNGTVPLHAATTSGNVNMMKLIIEKGADVKATTSNESNCLHIAARSGKDVVKLLVHNGININSKTREGFTPLHEATLKNHQDVVKSLIENGADIYALDPKGYTALHMAAASGYKNIVLTLIENNADINIENETGESPLFVAAQGNQKEIVELLLSHNATYSSIKCLFMAILQGNTSIVEILLNHRPYSILEKTDQSDSVLHVAVEFGQIDVVKLLLKKGADVNSTNCLKVAPLFMAAQKGFHEIAEIMIAGGASVNLSDNEGLTPLHAACKYGNFNIVQMLLERGAKPYVLDKTSRLPIEFAAAEGHLQIFKSLLQREKIDINRKGNDEFTMLHIAAQCGRFEIIEYLIEQGADVNSRNNNYSKAVHIAAREGFVDIVEMFMRNGIDIKDRGIGGNTLLHYASSYGKVNVMKYLLDRGLQVDNANIYGQTSLHIACQVNNQDSVEFLLHAGATYDILDVSRMKPINYCWNKSIIKVLNSLNQLFNSIKLNEIEEIEKLVRENVPVNVRHTEMMTPLHFAVYKNRENIVKVLLKNKASVNLISKNGWTVLHYAAKFSDIKIVKLLLFHGAKYNAVSDTGKTPFRFSRNDAVKSLLKLIRELFESVTKSDGKIISLMANIKDFETIKAVMNAQNKEGQPIMKCAMESDFPETEELKWIAQQDLKEQAQLSTLFILHEKYPQALEILEKIHKRRCDVFGDNHCNTLEIQVNIADILCKQQNYRKVVSICEDVYQKQVDLLGTDNEQSLRTNSMLGLALHRLGKNEQALNIFKDTHEKQKKILREDHDDLFRTQCHMALVLNALQKFEEALEMNKMALEISKRKFGILDPATLNIQNNIAMVFSNMGQYNQATKIYDDVYNTRKKILGAYHSDTLRCLRNKVGILKLQQKYDEALKAYEQIYNDQKQHLGLNHIDTLDTCHNIGDILLAQGKVFNAFKMFREMYDTKKNILGEHHPEVVQSTQRMKIITECLKLSGMPIDINNFLENLSARLTKACSEGDLQAVRNLLNSEIDVNEKDSEGRTPLHFAVDRSNLQIINLLLLKRADVTVTTNKGNTPLHTACSKNSKELVQILLDHVKKDKLYNFVNSQTNVGKQTALHIAAKKNNSEIVELLLEKGAIYNIRNKSGQTPTDVTQNQNIIELMKIIEGIFQHAQKDKVNSLLNMLNMMSRKDFVCVMSAHNIEGYTLLKILIGRGAIETSRIIVAKLKLDNV